MRAVPTHRDLAPTVLIALTIGAGCGAEPPRGRTRDASSTAPTSSVARPAVSRAVDVCVGSAHSCALDDGGAVRCWGDNAQHQVGPEAFAQTSTPTLVEGVPPAARLACDPSSACAVTRTGEVWCWGNEAGFASSGHVPVKLPFDAPVRDFVLTSVGGCAIGSDGAVRCFSRFLGPRFAPRVVPGVATATSFAPGPVGSTPCVQRAGEPALCFRVTSHHAPKSKAGSTLPPSPEPLTFDVIGASPPPTTMRPPPPPRLGALHAVETSGAHGCGIDDAGLVHCWGRATSGQLGDGTPYLHPPAEVPDLDAVSLSVGEGGACAVRRNGELVCWGRHAESDDAAPLREVATTFRSDEVAVGASLLDPARVCAREAVTKTWRCRFGAEWLTLDARFVGRPKPALLDAQGRTWSLGLHDRPTRDFFFSQIGASVVALSHDGYCAIDDRGALLCGHCGACDAPRAAVTKIVAGEPLVLVASLTHDVAEETSVCALGRSGTARCWEIATSPFSRAEPKPLAIEGLPGDLVDISSSGGRYEPNLTCVRTGAGAVHCFGDRAHGQHGGSRSRAARIEGLPPVVGVGTGGSFACAREAAGAVWCWGSNRDGGAPDGAPLERPDGVVAAVKAGGG
jgi:hypothetical protein